MLNERVRSVGFGEPLAISEAHLPLLAFVARKRGELRETSDIMRISSLLNGRRGVLLPFRCYLFALIACHL